MLFKRRSALQTVIGADVAGAQQHAAIARQRMAYARGRHGVDLRRPWPLPEQRLADHLLDQMPPRERVQLFREVLDYKHEPAERLQALPPRERVQLIGARGPGDDRLHRHQRVLARDDALRPDLLAAARRPVHGEPRGHDAV